MKRRQSLKLLSALPLISLVPGVAFGNDKAKPAAPAKGGAANMLDPNDTLAKAMQYKADASQVGPMRADKKAFCSNCAKYNVCMDGDKECKPLGAADLAKATAAPCQIFKGKVVAKDGWCLSWQAKG